MNGHLTLDELTAWTIGDRTPDQERHVAECLQCRAEAHRMETALAQFHSAVHEWSARETPSAPIHLAQAPARARPQARWVLAAATLLLFLAVPTYSHLARERAAERARQDAVLLEQVDSEVSRAVPGPMEPLVQLVSWGAGPTTSNTHKESR